MALGAKIIVKEFQIIEKYFSTIGPNRKDVALGIGDDCALVQPAKGKQIAISCDTLVEGVHFFADMPPKALGYKSLAVNLSDLAAMGAEPAWMTLAISMPEVDESWLAPFCEGLAEAADYYGVSLIGGDTTKGHKSFTITIHGQVQQGMALTRAGAKIGDWIYVTGTLGDSALGLDILRNVVTVEPECREFLINRHYNPTPRVLAGQALRGHASSAIDLSDGLISDLGHILKASKLGAVIEADSIPLSKSMLASVSLEQALGYALTGGEDYELLFTVPESERGAIDTALLHAGVKFIKIGQLCAGNSIKFTLHGKPFTPEYKGFTHF